jgi:hypothetical protein
MLLALAFAVRDRVRRWLVVALGVALGIGYLLTLSVLVGWDAFRALILRLPFGDVYLHNPGRLRFLAFMVVPLLGAIGIQSLLDRPPPFRQALRWFACGFVVFGVFPLVAGAYGLRLVVFALGSGTALFVWHALADRRRWAAVALVGVLSAELLAGSVWSSMYTGGTLYFGLEGNDHPALVQGPLRFPNVPLERYLSDTPISRIARAITYAATTPVHITSPCERCAVAT